MSDELRPIDAAASAASQRLDWRLMLPVFIVVSLDAASSGAILPILPFYLRTLGASPLVLGLVLAAEALSQFVAAPGWGNFPTVTAARGSCSPARPERSSASCCWRLPIASSLCCWRGSCSA
ncbi:hypothetical protein ACOJBM_15150 [Rhizobium beringeri]